MTDRPRRLLIGEGAGIGPTLLLAEQMRPQSGGPVPAAAPGRPAAPAAVSEAVLARRASATPAARLRPLVLLGSDTLFPFRPRPSVIIVPGIPTGVIACMPLLEEWGIASRLASTADLPGCFEGTVTALADTWLSSLTPTDLAEVEIFAHGPAPMLEATASLARRLRLPCQVSRDA